jgi:hypothetical protein
VKRIALLPLLLALFVAGCDAVLDQPEVQADPNAQAPGIPPLDPPAGEDDPAPDEQPAPPVFTAAVDHPFFPMAPGSYWVLEGEDDGEHRRDEVEVLAEPHEIAGVACTAVHQRVYLDGELAEVTTEWFAQDESGNLWKFGEESHELDDEVGLFVRTDDSWTADEGDIAPWMFFPAAPREGDVYLGEQPESGERMQVLSLTTTAAVPAGTFTECLEVLETTADIEDPDVVIYAPEVGLVSETSTTGFIELVDFGVR